jgi:alpha-D-ribose 1-methylphosphonate 5-triphosphate synthase subunit PhnG
MNADNEVRRKRMAAFARGALVPLAAGLERIVSAPVYDFLRRPESGLIMVRGRIGGDGRAFNMGEMLVSRCTIAYGDYVGHGWVPGRNQRQAELAALGDALGQMPEHRAAIDALVEELEVEKNTRRAKEQADIKKTQVQFFTLVRGEDDDD